MATWTATVEKIQDATPMGTYRRTAVDDQKDAADFRVVAVGRKTDIIWRDGRHERVTDRQLTRLQAVHTWAADF